MNCLIYKIVNNITQKVYIGQTWSTLQNRFRQHKISTHCFHLNNAFNKYGRENFSIHFITLAHTQEIADYWEIYFIKQYDSTNRANGYNLNGGGRGHRTISEETRQKMSLAQKGKRLGTKLSEETKRKIGEASKGNKHNLGRIPSEKTKQKMSETHQGLNNWSEGNTWASGHIGYCPKHSEEVRKKISDAKKLWWANKKKAETK